MEKKVSKNKSKKEFKQTKELMKIARDNGWTQIEIAEKCRTQQSIVSAWFKGTKKATENQLRPLLDEFGHQLRRNTFRIYQNITEENKLEYFKIEGRIIFNYTIYNIITIRINGKSIDKHIKNQRLIVHFQGGHKFIFIRQTRIKTSENDILMESHPNYVDTLWFSEISCIMKIDELIDTVIQFTEDLNKKIEIKFLLIEALLNNGFHVDNIKVYPASW